MRRVAVLGGTFDPVHRGHLAIAEQATDVLGAEEGWLMPSGTPPHRRPASAPASARWVLVEAAVGSSPRLRAVDLEMRRDGPSYTVDTIAELRRHQPGVEPWLIVGADAAPSIRTWHRADELLAQARFALVDRRGEPPLDAAVARGWGFPAERTRILRVDAPAASSSEVRRRVAAGEPVDDLVPEAVARLIAELGLYTLP